MMNANLGHQTSAYLTPAYTSDGNSIAERKVRRPPAPLTLVQSNYTDIDEVADSLATQASIVSSSSLQASQVTQTENNTTSTRLSRRTRAGAPPPSPPPSPTRASQPASNTTSQPRSQSTSDTSHTTSQTAPITNPSKSNSRKRRADEELVNERVEIGERRPPRPLPSWSRSRPRAPVIEEGEIKEGRRPKPRTKRGSPRTNHVRFDLSRIDPSNSASLAPPDDGPVKDKGKGLASDYAAAPRIGYKSARAQLQVAPFTTSATVASLDQVQGESVPASEPSTLTTFTSGITSALPVPTTFGQPAPDSAFTQPGGAGTLSSTFGSSSGFGNWASTTSAKPSGFGTPALSGGQTASGFAEFGQKTAFGGFVAATQVTSAFGPQSVFGQAKSTGFATNTSGSGWLPSPATTPTRSTLGMGSSSSGEGLGANTHSSDNSPMKGVEGVDSIPMKAFESHSVFGNSRSSSFGGQSASASAFLHGGTAGTPGKTFGHGSGSSNGFGQSSSGHGNGFGQGGSNGNGSDHPGSVSSSNTPYKVALNGMGRCPHYPIPIFDAFNGPVPAAAMIALQRWLHRITDGSNGHNNAAPIEELAQIPLVMRSHGSSVRQVLTGILRGPKTNNQTLKMLEVVSWLEPADARPLRMAIRGCLATNNAAVKGMAVKVLGDMERKGY
ncbi:hypothetical protein CcaverHIS631_0602920 [Cutaneotrichosporon cavernicola]|nr:hypothetical protein CcaverHIS631_0602920 [Cutaneotrichosporon cavernicola]